MPPSQPLDPAVLEQARALLAQAPDLIAPALPSMPDAAPGGVGAGGLPAGVSLPDPLGPAVSRLQAVADQLEQAADDLTTSAARQQFTGGPGTDFPTFPPGGGGDGTRPALSFPSIPDLPIPPLPAFWPGRAAGAPDQSTMPASWPAGRAGSGAGADGEDGGFPALPPTMPAMPHASFPGANPGIGGSAPPIAPGLSFLGGPSHGDGPSSLGGFDGGGGLVNGVLTPLVEAVDRNTDAVKSLQAVMERVAKDEAVAMEDDDERVGAGYQGREAAPDPARPAGREDQTRRMVEHLERMMGAGQGWGGSPGPAHPAAPAPSGGSIDLEAILEALAGLLG